MSPFQGLPNYRLIFFIGLHPMLGYTALLGLLKSTLHYKC